MNGTVDGEYKQLVLTREKDNRVGHKEVSLKDDLHKV
jgi:hypothetical protein